MAPFTILSEIVQDRDSIAGGGYQMESRRKRAPDVEKPVHPNALILESWAQGYMVGSLIIMAAITVANMRRGTLLHKLILLELLLGTFHGTFIFTSPPVYGWYLSVTAIFLNISWSLHNVIAWIKTKPFLSRRWSLFYIGTVLLAQPYWVLEIYANFAYFNNINGLFLHTRPYEALFRDPWWIFSTINLFYNITVSYHLSIPTIIRLSPRFGVLLLAMTLSICFIIVDIISVTNVLRSLLPDGLNPFWKLAFVFKCLTDSIILDDFKTALDKLMRFKMERESLGTVATTDGILTSDCGGSYRGLFDNMAHRGCESITMVGNGDESKPRGGRIPRLTRDDPLGEDMMEAERTGQARAATKTMTLEQMLGAERIDVVGDLRNSAGRASSSVGRKAMAQHIEHWDDISLPGFETSTYITGRGDRDFAG